jgi:hypothetical protein
VDHQSKEAEQDRLRTENQQLQSLILQGKMVAPVVELAFRTSASEPAGEHMSELDAWQATQPTSRVPKPVGFMPRLVRAALFPHAEPDTLFHYIGDISVRTARLGYGVRLQVRDDGSIVPSGLSPQQPKSTEVHLLDNSGVIINISFTQNLDALQVFQSVLRQYEHKRAPIVMRSFITSPNCSNQQLLSISGGNVGRLTFFLDDARQIAVTALLKSSPVTTEDKGTTYEWSFAEPPHLEVTLPGGLH